jgi:cobyrinic acid a,c-diamide synthase
MHPRIVIAALRGGSGKTILSLGLISAWREKGLAIASFKKGPDFIDAGWLAFAAGRPCYNLDPFLMNEGQIRHSFITRSSGMDLSVIEGNRGLYDGLDLHGSSSTAELAKGLKAPVLIALDVSMTTRTLAAVVKGCQAFDPDLHISGIILNRVAGRRQEDLIRAAIETYCQVPVVGSVPKLKADFFPERHMGLVPHQERDQAKRAVAYARQVVKDHLQLDEIWRMAHAAPALEAAAQTREMPSPIAPTESADTVRPRIGYIEDRAFWFYYPENLEQLKTLGADLIRLDAISSPTLPDLDALYIGGGFPETQAQALADNKAFRGDLRNAIENGLPVYAECGGFMYLGERLVVGETSYPMVGALPLEFVLQKRPQGHGYTVLEVARKNSFYPVGKTLRGHEFHYSRARPTSKDAPLDYVFRVKRGRGIEGTQDGISKKNLLASYTHIHAAGEHSWARGLLRAAKSRKKRIFS